MTAIQSRCVTLASVVLCLAPLVGLADDVPPRTNAGQTLVVPKDQLDSGDVYYITPGEDGQIVCTSDAPLQRAVARCSRVVGYFVTPYEIEAGQPPLVAGALRIPVASLSTGLEALDAGLYDAKLLNVAEFPEITFRLTRVSDAKLINDEKGRKSYTLTLAGDLTIKNKTIPQEFPARLELIPFTWQTMGRNVGDLLTLRATLDSPLASLGLEIPNRSFAGRIADTIHVEIFLLGNVVSPEKNFDPDVKNENYTRQLRFLTLIRDFNDPEKGYEFGRAFLRDIWDDAPALSRLALATLTEDGIRTRDLAFAAKAAQRASELTEFKDPTLLSTLARVCFEKADFESAIKYARQAVELAEKSAPPTVDELRATLARYEKRAAADR